MRTPHASGDLYHFNEKQKSTGKTGTAQHNSATRVGPKMLGMKLKWLRLEIHKKSGVTGFRRFSKSACKLLAGDGALGSPRQAAPEAPTRKAIW